MRIDRRGPQSRFDAFQKRGHNTGMQTTSYPHRRLGALSVSSMGLGCMGMTSAYGERDDAQAMATIHRARDLGITLLDTAEVYGPYNNEELVGRTIAGRRADFIIATKFGFRIGADNKVARGVAGIDGRPENARRAVEGSLKRLGIDTIDLFYLHRLDPKIPIEDSVGAMADLVKAGKVRFLGLSEVGPATIRRAHAVHPIAAVQSEYSLWERGIEAAVLPTLRELGIGLVPFCPLGRGFLTGALTSTHGLGSGDFRLGNPRFSNDNMSRNAALVTRIAAVAKRHAATPAQVALAWVLAQGDDVVPIPGTKRVRYLEENAAARSLALGSDDFAVLDTIAAAVAGPRYDEHNMAMVDR
jgi:aryl-alcohol dehydrogenase-like predicted oxidoreductase